MLAALKQNRRAVLCARPGAGKTTRVPAACLKSYSKKILVVQPRRLACTAAASYVAAQMGESCGEICGYQVRFEKCLNSRTRLLYLTSGMLVRYLMSDSELKNVDLVILDEFHERDMQQDLLAAWCFHLQKQSQETPDLLVMSATLDSRLLSNWMDSAPVFVSEGRMFDVEQRWQEPEKNETLALQLRRALYSLQDLEGDILVFLPGRGEIEYCRKELEKCSWNQKELVSLYGELPLEQQKRVLALPDENRVILATNIAETSITLSAVKAVIDSGLVRTVVTDLNTGSVIWKPGR